jgi:SAM-dependent methyltransferase
MFERTISADDLARLKSSREAADQRYNEALTALDAAAQAPDLALPKPPPGPDDTQAAALNEQWEILPAGSVPVFSGWRGKLAGFVWRLVAPALERQQTFNSRLVDHLNRNLAVEHAVRGASEQTLAALDRQAGALAAFQSRLIVFLQQLTPYVDTKDHESAGLDKRVNEDAREILDILDHRTVGLMGAINGVSDELLKRWESMVARERRYDAKVVALTAAHEDVRNTLAIVHQASLTIKREIERLRSAPPAIAIAGSGGTASGDAAGAGADAGAGSGDRDAGAGARVEGVAAGPAGVLAAVSASQAHASSIDSYKYVGFEDRYRGSQDDIRARQIAYLPYFAGASDVLDLGCGRGEFLELLRENGVGGRGLDVNHEMVEVCRERGLNVAEGDAVGYLRGLADGELGGLIALQVVEHLEPGYLMELLELAYYKLRPGSHIILETINPACWYAFFSSYIRDITHVRPLHPDTLSYFVSASGFQQVAVRYSAPYPEEGKLQRLPDPGPLADVFNANVAKLNGLMFTNLDYAAIGVRP